MGQYTRVFVATADCLGNGHGVYLSTNNGITWTNITNEITNTCVTPNCWVDALSIIGNTLFAGTVGRGVFLSTDNGTTWTASNAGLTTLYVQTFATNGTDIFVGTWGNDGGVFRSTNGGASWIDISAGLTDSHVQALIAIGTNLFVGTESNGIFLSTNNGANWTQVNAGLTDYWIMALAAVGPYLFAGSDRSGVWRRPLSEVITAVDNEPTETANSFSLRQNYPNPFNPTTSIAFTLSSKSFVSLKVFDPLGREVAILHADELPAGTYSTPWDAAGMPNGVYFYRLQAGSFTETKRLILLR
ncbi:MAG: T9SS type A sorting domain-containing protein [Bacteroidota bacterium]|nr:T9SS type A sorting domain-containing protein [Bacteroidota bacterium]